MTISAEEWKEIRQIHTELRSNRERYVPLWKDISNVTGITVDPDYMWTNNGSKDKQLDEYVDDPTAAISVNQAGDYMYGIMWGTGEKVVDILPSDHVTELVDAQVVAPWYKYATSQFLDQMNHVDCGYGTALRPYCYDQFSFGTSGIGLFKNHAFTAGIEENCMIARNYGIDNTCIDEGKNGAPDIGETVYHWAVSRIIGEFCCVDGTVDPKMLSQMPRRIQMAYEKGDYNQEFDLVFLWRPRKDWDPKLKGKRGARYQGVWFLDNGAENAFYEESFAERPINMARAIKVRGERYGRAYGTLLLSSIRSLNFTFAVTAEILEKMANPAVGIFGNSIFGDSVLDTSPNGLTVFNQTQTADGKPIFPLHDVGDPSGIIQFLMPYLKDAITTGFKIDALLDMNTDGTMTATEALQRYNIRGKSLAGMLGMQKVERLIPDARRGISICWDSGVLGVDAALDTTRAGALKKAGRIERIIPKEVLQVVKAGKPWYKLRWNNELEKLVRTEQIQALIQLIQAITAIAALYPMIVQAVNWYQMLKDLNDALDYNNQILVTEQEFKKIIAQAAAERSAMMQIQAAEGMAKTQQAGSVANKNNSEAQLNAQA